MLLKKTEQNLAAEKHATLYNQADEKAAARKKKCDAEKQDLTESVAALKKAVMVLKSGSGNTGFMQMKNDPRIARVIALLEAERTYTSQNNGVIDLVEKLYKDFKKQLGELKLKCLNQHNSDSMTKQQEQQAKHAAEVDRDEAAQAEAAAKLEAAEAREESEGYRRENSEANDNLNKAQNL